MEEKNEKKFTGLVSHAKSMSNAVRGIRIFIFSTPNAWVELAFGILVFTLGMYFSISATQWLLLFVVVFLVLAAEAFNTAIEVHMDLTSPQYHPFARDTKDIAAGAVLILSILALIVAFGIFFPKIFPYCF